MGVCQDSSPQEAQTELNGWAEPPLLLRMGKYRESKEQEVLLPHFTTPAYKGRDHIPFHYPWACSSNLGYSNSQKITYLMWARSQSQDLPEWMEYVPSKIEQLGETDENLNKKIKADEKIQYPPKYF